MANACTAARHAMGSKGKEIASWVGNISLNNSTFHLVTSQETNYPGLSVANWRWNGQTVATTQWHSHLPWTGNRTTTPLPLPQRILPPAHLPTFDCRRTTVATMTGLSSNNRWPIVWPRWCRKILKDAILFPDFITTHPTHFAITNVNPVAGSPGLGAP